jgi:RNA polymerase sigma-70 factor (ECF subfamily)
MEQAPDELKAPDAVAADARDALLVQRALREPEAFGLIYERFYPVILNYVFRRTMSVSAAEEVTSNTFFKALRALPKYRSGEQPIRSWLYAIATNEMRMLWRWRKRHPAVSLDELNASQRVLFEQHRGGARTQGGLEQHEDRDQQLTDFAKLHEALARLPQRYQTVIALRYFEHLTLEQIAGVIRKPVGSVKSRLHRATAKLKSAVQQSEAAAAATEHPGTIRSQFKPPVSSERAVALDRGPVVVGARVRGARAGGIGGAG